MSLDAKQIAKAVLDAKKPVASEEKQSDGDDGLEVAARNILSASKSGDASELASSLREFVTMCGDS